MLSELHDLLTPKERDAIRAVFQIDAEQLDLNDSRIEESPDWIRARFASAAHCPFELHFGRATNEARFNFYIGLGAEFYNYEELDSDADVSATADDVRRFLMSTIRCKFTRRKDRVVRATYFPSLLVVDGQPVRLYYRRDWWPFSGGAKEVVVYHPWLQAPRG